jgi:hypothetical protein
MVAYENNLHKIVDFLSNVNTSDTQKIICIDELAELIVEISKDIRNRPDAKISEISKEMAHVLISISILMKIYGISDDDIDCNIANKIKEYGLWQ